jgi:class 3 adenylate cyclase
MRLRTLSEREVKALLEEVSRQTLETPDELALADAVYRESGGNPYFIEEIIRHLVESRAIYQRDGKWVSDARHIGELGIPRGIRDVIDRRLSRLSEDCRELLATAAAIGHEFQLQILDRVSGQPAATVSDHLREAVDVDIIAPVPDERGTYGFAHFATRDALYQALPRAGRVALHQAIGEALEDLYEDRIESHLGELAHHFAQAAPAGLAEKAADYAWWAGERAAALFAYDEAVAQYTRARELFDTLPDEPVRRCELLLVMGDARRRAGDVAGARETFLEVAGVAEKLALPDQYARAALGYGGEGGGFSASDRADQTLLELLRTALEMVPERDSVLRVRVMARLGVELYYTNNQNEAEALSGATVEMAERLGDAKIVLLATYSRQWATMGPDGLESALEAANEIVRLARVVGDPETEFHGHHLRVNTLLQLGDIRAVDREIRACEKLAKDLRQPSYEWQLAVFRAMRALMQGRFQEGERLAQAAFAIGQRGQAEEATVVFGAHTFLTSWAAGKLDQLAEGGEAFAASYPSSAWPAALTWLLSEIDDRPKTSARFNDLARDGFTTIRRDANWLTAMSTLSLTASYLGAAKAAEVLYEMLAPYANRCTPILVGAACLGSNHAFLGHLAEAAGRLDRAADHFEQALDVNERIGAAFLAPRIDYAFARTLLARDGDGDRDRATELIEKGLEAARKLGLPKEVERLLSIKLDAQGLTDVDVQTSIDAVVESVEQTRPDLTRAAAPDGTVTILFSDIEDSTVLTEKLGDHRWLELLSSHNLIVRKHLVEHGGYEVKSQGDGFMLAFASARKAIHCAIGIQRALAEHRQNRPDEALKVRIGLHTGETMHAEEDFFGKNVILAARIAACARGDEILVSALLRELVASTGEFEFDNERELELKGLSGRYRVAAVPWHEVSAAAPVSA